MLDRRNFLVAAGAAAALPMLPGCAAQRASAGGAPDDSALKGMLDEIAESLLREYPENATSLGLDKGARAGLKSRLTDRSLEGYHRLGAAAIERRDRLRAIPRDRLTPAAAVDLDVVQTAHGIAADGFDFPYGDVVTLNQNLSYRNSPYVVAQNTGAFVEIPDFLDSNHVVATAQDADAYLDRLDGYARILDGETERLEYNRRLGVIAPDFLLDKTLRQMRGARGQPPAEWGLVTSLVRRTASIPGDGGDARCRSSSAASGRQWTGLSSAFGLVRLGCAATPKRFESL